jgi:hypothetical protein
MDRSPSEELWRRPWRFWMAHSGAMNTMQAVATNVWVLQMHEPPPVYRVQAAWSSGDTRSVAISTRVTSPPKKRTMKSVNWTRRPILTPPQCSATPSNEYLRGEVSRQASSRKSNDMKDAAAIAVSSRLP